MSSIYFKCFYFTVKLVEKKSFAQTPKIYDWTSWICHLFPDAPQRDIKRDVNEC